MKKTVLIILTVLALASLIFSIFLSLSSSTAKLHSSGTKMDDKIDNLSYSEKLRNPTAASLASLLKFKVTKNANGKKVFVSDTLTAYSATFNAAENFGFSIKSGLMFALDVFSMITFATTVVIVLLFVANMIIAYVNKKKENPESAVLFPVKYLKLVHMFATVGALLTLLFYTISLVLLQNILEMVSIVYSINCFLILAIEAVFLVGSTLAIKYMNVSDDPEVEVLYSPKAYEKGGIKEFEAETKTKSAKKAPKSKENA